MTSEDDKAEILAVGAIAEDLAIMLGDVDDGLLDVRPGTSGQYQALKTGSS